MMKPSALSEQLDAGLRDFAWDELGQMGARSVPQRRSRWAQDPEALVIFTLEVGRDEPRLFDELLGWLLANESLLSVRRLRAMCRGVEDEQLLAGALRWLAQRRPRARLALREPSRPVEAEPLFRGLTTPVRMPDPAFAAVGLLRPVFEPFEGGTLDVRAPINLALRLRQLLGVGARAEVVRYLLTVKAESVNAPEVARSAGFAKRNVHEALVSLHAAGVVTRLASGSEQRYMIDRTAWAHLLGTRIDELPQERAWPQLLAALRTIQRWLHDLDLDQRSAYLRASRARDLLEQVRPDLAHAGMPVGRRPGVGAWDDLEALVAEALLDLSAGDPWAGE
jgi:hypothetical protein